MGNATVALTDFGDLMRPNSPSVSELGHQPQCPGSQTISDYCFEDIIGNSSALQRVLEQVAIVAPTSATVLLHGETGRKRTDCTRNSQAQSPAPSQFCLHELR